MIFLIYGGTYFFYVILELSVQCYSINRSKHYLQKLVVFIGFTDEFVFTHAGLLINQWHNIALDDVMVVNKTRVIFYLSLLSQMWIFKAS